MPRIFCRKLRKDTKLEVIIKLGMHMKFPS
jgi:hypothetical protein